MLKMSSTSMVSSARKNENWLVRPENPANKVSKISAKNHKEPKIMIRTTWMITF